MRVMVGGFALSTQISSIDSVTPLVIDWLCQAKAATLPRQVAKGTTAPLPFCESMLFHTVILVQAVVGTKL